MIDMNTVTDEQADYMNTPMEAVEEIDMLWDKLSAFFPELGGYIETDFCERTARRMVWDIEKGFAALPDKFRAVAFHHAVLTDDSDIVKAFIKAAKNAKADIDTDFSDSEYGTPPLMQACYNKCRNAFVSLVAGGASLSVKDAMGRGLAHACVFSHNLAFMKWAQKHGVVFDLNNPVDAVLPLAGAECSVAVLRWLIEDLRGDVNTVDAEGHTAMYYACLFEVRKNILFLIDKGAYPVEGSENAFVPIVQRIKELRAQRPSGIIDFEIDCEIQKLKNFARKI